MLAYAEGFEDLQRQRTARALFASAAADNWVIPVQVLGELYTILVCKLRLSRNEANARVQIWRNVGVLVDTSAELMETAMSLAVAHQLSIWDAVVVAAAAQAGCRLLLSEDMQDGFTWGGVTIVNPFAPAPHPLLIDLMRP